MIKTLSPYYVSIPLVNPTTLVVCDSYTINLFIWSGNKTAVPATPEYEITKINAAASNGTDKVNISRIVNDFIDFNITPNNVTSLDNSTNQVWVKFVVYYNDQPELEQLVFAQLAIKGYGYFTDGENSDVPSNKVLLNVNEYKVNRNGTFVMGIVLDEPTPAAPVLTIDSIAEAGLDTWTVTFSTNIDYSVVYWRYSISGDNDWTVGTETATSSPFDIFLPVFVPYDIQIFTYDPLTDTEVYSNIYLLAP